jgi:hypothetical protein
MTDIQAPKIIAALCLLVLLLGILRTLHKRDKCGDSKISFDDLLLDPDGRMSKSAVVMFGSFALTTWMMVVLTLSGKVTEGYFTAYAAAWIIPSVTKLIRGSPSEAPQP